MGNRKVIVKQSAADNIAAVAWFIESKGMLVTADKFTDDAYDYLIHLSDSRKSYPACKESGTASWGINVYNIKRNIPLCLLKPTRN